MNAYIVTVRSASPEVKPVTLGRLAETQEQAEAEINALSIHYGETLSVLLVPLSKAIVRRWDNATKRFVTCEVLAAVTDGFLLYLPADGKKFVSRCRAEWRDDKHSVYCTIYGKNQEVFWQLPDRKVGKLVVKGNALWATVSYQGLLVPVALEEFEGNRSSAFQQAIKWAEANQNDPRIIQNPE